MSDHELTPREIFTINCGADPEEMARYGYDIDPYADQIFEPKADTTEAMPEEWQIVIEEASLYQRCRKGHSNIF